MESVRDMQQRDREERFTTLASLVSEPLQRYLARRTDQDTAQDVLAETLVVLWRRLDDVPTDNPLPWCYAVTRRCLANAARTARRQRRLVERLTLARSPDCFEPVLEDAELHDALGHLSEQDRELVRLWAWEQLAPQEIAVVLGVTPNAARIRLHRARAKLRQLLAGRNGWGGAGQEQVDKEEVRMTDDEGPDGAKAMLLQRMQTADPARTFHTADSWMPDVMEAAMNTTPIEPKSRPRRWAPAIAAAASVAVLGGAAYAVLGASDPAGSPSSTVTTLAMPAGGGTSMNSCLPFDAQYLRDMPVALSGTATKVDDDGVTLDVDRWYAGGNADVVRLANYDVNTVSLDGFAFEPGSRYLITATEGTVNLCGFSGPWTHDLADAYGEAFST